MNGTTVTINPFMCKEIIKITNLSYRYPGKKENALEDITFTVLDGEFIGIAGNGKSGKSSLCQAIAGIVPHCYGGYFQGEIMVDGISVRKSTPSVLAAKVGIVMPDAESQFSQETVEDEIAFIMCNLGFDRPLMIERVKFAVESCGLQGLLHRSPYSLSGGQQQRLAIACVIALGSKIIVLDDADSQLDPEGKDDIFSLIKTVHKKGIAVIFSSHDVERLAEYSDKMLILEKGKLVCFGKPENVLVDKYLFKELSLKLPQVTRAAILLQDKVPLMDIPVTIDAACRIFEKLLGGNPGE